MTSELDAQRVAATSNKAVVIEIEQTVHQLSRQSMRAEEKLLHLRKQITARGAETQQAVDELHKQLLDAELARSKV